MSSMAAMDVQDTEIPVYANNANLRVLRWLLLVLLIWNLLLTYFLRQSNVFNVENGQAMSRPQATLRDGYDLVIGANRSIRVRGNIFVSAPEGQQGIGRGNVVIGDEHDYSQAKNSFVAGRGHRVSGEGASVLAGRNNLVAADFAAVIGGEGNSALAPHSVVSGGTRNRAGGRYATAAGGDTGRADSEAGYFAPPNSAPPNAAVLRGFEPLRSRPP